MSDFRQFERMPRKKRKRRTVRDSFNGIIARSKRSIDVELNHFFRRTLTTKPL